LSNLLRLFSNLTYIAYCIHCIFMIIY
jgi:hypothetical protein